MFNFFGADSDVDSTSAEEQGNWPSSGDSGDSGNQCGNDSGSDSDMGDD